MSRWTHYLCEECYRILEHGREPVRILEPELGDCCRCNAQHVSGIYYRCDPQTLMCDGIHKDDDE